MELPYKEPKFQFNEGQARIIGIKERGAIELYDEIINKLPPEAQEIAQNAFTKFMTRDDDYVRRNMDDMNVSSLR